MNDTSAIFIAVGTPSKKGDGHADLSYVYEVAKEIAENFKEYAVIVNKSTVPVGIGEKVHDIIKKINPKLDFDCIKSRIFKRFSNK